jgi:hypothetical protein
MQYSGRIVVVKIKQAKVVRYTERNDVPCADVEVYIEGSDEVMLAEFTPSQDNQYDLTHIYRKEASLEVDGYENNLHQAFKDITTELFGNADQEIKWGEREAFKQQVLSFGSVQKELEEHLPE